MHKATATWRTKFLERQASLRNNGLHLCYGKRCAEHHNNWYAWAEGTAK